MALLNVIMIWFYIIQPETHLSLLNYMENLSTPPPSIGFYSKGDNIEAGTTIKISSGGLNGSLIANGAISLRGRLNIKDNLFADLSTLLTDNVSSYSLAAGKYFNTGHIKLRGQLRYSFISYYELNDKYWFNAINAEIITPFMWGKYFSPFVGLNSSYNYYRLPENIRSSPIKGISFKAITGLNFKYKYFTSCIFLSINRESFSSGIYFGFIK